MKELKDLSNPSLLKELFRQLFNNSSHPLFITDIDFKFTECNTAFDLLFQKEEDSVKRDYLVELFEHDKSLGEVLSILDHEGIVDDHEVTFRDYESERIYVLLSLIPIKSEEGELIGYQGIIHDETDRVLAQRQLQRAQRIAMTGRMLRTIAHEIRNPLTNVNLAISSLRESEMSEDDTFMIDLIHKNSNRINDLLTELLDSSKPADLHMKSISLQDLVKETVLLAEDRMQLLRIMLNYDMPDTPVMIQADIRKVTLAINNILINATEAMPNGGALTISVRVTSKRVRLTIADTGAGMSEDTLNHLFDPFFSGKSKGTGLGLTATLNILQSHGWHIHVESTEDEGSQFHIKIPVESH